MTNQYIRQLLITLVALGIYFLSYLAPNALTVTVIYLADLAFLIIATIINTKDK